MPGIAKLVATVTLLCSGSVWAAGTLASTEIENFAIATYLDSEGIVRRVESNVTRFKVDEVLDVAVASNDSARRNVSSPASAQSLSFTVVNVGNGSETYRLNIDAALSGDQFDPDNVRIYIDDGDKLFDPTVDRLYVAGVNDPLLDPDGRVVVFVVADIPAGRVDGDTGDVSLQAVAATGSGPPGTLFPRGGDAEVDAVVGANGAAASAQNGYLRADFSPRLSKSQTVTDADGGSNPVSGATVTYTIVLDVSGIGSSLNTVISDPVPVGTRYVADSLTLDGSRLSDAADSDAGSVNDTGLRVELGTVTAPATHTVTFQVTIE